MDSIIGNNTWVMVDLPLGCKPLRCKWIFNRKMKVDGTIKKFKARLAIQSFRQKSGIDYFHTYALVARISTIRLLKAMTSIQNPTIDQMDVKTAFLNGKLEEEVDMTKEFLSSRFSMKDIREADVILSIRIKHKSNGIAISQSHHIEKVLKKFNCFDCTPVSTPMDSSEKLMPNNGQVVSQLKYSRVIGCLMYAMTCTRPDIAFNTIFDAPPGYVGLYTHSFSLENIRLPLIDFFCKVLEYFWVHISRLNPFGCAKLTTFVVMCKAYKLLPASKVSTNGFSMFKIPLSLPRAIPRIWYWFSFCFNAEPPKDVEEPKVQPTEVTVDSGESLKAGVFVVHLGSVDARIKERKCKTRGGSSRPLIKRKLAFEPSSSHVMCAKTSASKDDAHFLSISDDDEGLLDCFKLKDANAYHLKIYAITPPAWKGHLDNQMDLELLDLHDHYYA
nr:zinc finger, CCHC-type [Tanacetum cinerariifolium]